MNERRRACAVVVWVEFQDGASRLPGIVANLRDADDRLPPPLRIDGRANLQFHSGTARPRLHGGRHRKPAGGMAAPLVGKLQRAIAPLERQAVGRILLCQA